MYLKRGESLTYGIGQSLTCGIGESLTSFEVLKERKDMLIVRKAKKKIVRPDGLHEAWVYQSPALPLIAFKDVVKECAESCGEHPSKTTGVVAALMDRIAHYLKIGRSVRIEAGHPRNQHQGGETAILSAPALAAGDCGERVRVPAGTG